MSKTTRAKNIRAPTTVKRMDCPLYDELARLVSLNEDLAVDIERVRLSINDIAKNLPYEQMLAHYLQIEGLIIHHNIVTNNGVTCKVPYDGKLMGAGKGIINYMGQMPVKLQQIIAQYIEMFAV